MYPSQLKMFSRQHNKREKHYTVYIDYESNVSLRVNVIEPTNLQITILSADLVSIIFSPLANTSSCDS